MSAMLLVQLGVTACLAAPLFFLVRAVFYGLSISESDDDDSWFLQDLESHKTATSGLLCSTIIMIFVVECAVRWTYTQGRVAVSWWLFALHLLGATLFLGLIVVLKFWITGEHDKLSHLHKPLAYTCAVSGLWTVGSGLYMLWSW